MGMQFPRSVLPPPVDPLAQRSAVVKTSPAARQLREVVTRAAGTDCSLKTLYHKLNEYSRQPRMAGA